MPAVSVVSDNLLTICLKCTFRRLFSTIQLNLWCFSCVQDDTALLLLGQCYESGFGVQKNLRTAIEFYKQATQAGNKQAEMLLMPPMKTDGTCKHTLSWHCMWFYLKMSQDSSSNIHDNEQQLSPSPPPAQDAALRSIRSSPCFSLYDRQLQQPLSSLTSHVRPSNSPSSTLPLLPHSWSTGSLYTPPALSSTSLPPHLHSREGAACHWTLEIGNLAWVSAGHPEECILTRGVCMKRVNIVMSELEWIDFILECAWECVNANMCFFYGSERKFFYHVFIYSVECSCLHPYKDSWEKV